MVKLSFSSALGQKDLKKDAESLIPEEDEGEVGVRGRSRAWCWGACLSLALLLAGVLVGGAYLYRYYSVEEGQVFTCGTRYREQDFMVPEEGAESAEEAELAEHLRQVEETFRILEEQQVELIHVPVPQFSDSDPADIVHDFSRRLTAYLDLNLNRCYVINLNTSVVLPPRDLVDLLINIKAGTYLPQSYLVHEEMVVTERLERVDQLGFFIYSLCKDKETYKLQRRDRVLGMQKREVLNCHKIRHFESKFVVETMICEPY